MLVLAAVAMNAFLSTFGGTWTCTPQLPAVASGPVSTWRIQADPNSSWTVVRWSSRGYHSTAFVGYLTPTAQWLYEEFRSDGSFSSNTSSGPQNGTWTWTGTFTSPEREQHGAIQWRRTKNGFRQGFGRMLGPSFREIASAECRPVTR
jgi:hypothetical protein